MMLESELSQQCEQQGSSLPSDAPLTGNTRSEGTGGIPTDRPPKPTALKWGATKEDGRRFYQYSWSRGRGEWVERWLSPEAFDRDLQSKIKYTAGWQKRNPGSLRKSRVKYQTATKYGLTGEQRISLLEYQGNRCAGCGSTLSGGNKCHTDHCHSTGVVRGYLCPACNMGLGCLKESYETFQNLMNYLRDPPAFRLGIHAVHRDFAKDNQ